MVIKASPFSYQSPHLFCGNDLDSVFSLHLEGNLSHWSANSNQTFYRKALKYDDIAILQCMDMHVSNTLDIIDTGDRRSTCQVYAKVSDQVTLIN